jgi:hypothetical protein
VTADAKKNLGKLPNKEVTKEAKKVEEKVLNVSHNQFAKMTQAELQGELQALFKRFRAIEGIIPKLANNIFLLQQHLED